MISPINLQFISVAEAALRIGCTPDHVRLMLRSKQLTGHKFSERTWLVDVESVATIANTPAKTGRPRTSAKTF